jgi:hypothetical protein
MSKMAPETNPFGTSENMHALAPDQAPILMSEYELKRMGNIARNNARLASLGLLVPMTSAATLSSNLSNRKKRLASQYNAERRIQPKCNAKQLTSYRYFNDNNDDYSNKLDRDTFDSVLLSDEDSYLNDNDDDSHDELDINTMTWICSPMRKEMRPQRKAPSCSATAAIAMAPRFLRPL